MFSRIFSTDLIYLDFLPIPFVIWQFIYASARPFPSVSKSDQRRSPAHHSTGLVRRVRSVPMLWRRSRKVTKAPGKFYIQTLYLSSSDSRRWRTLSREFKFDIIDEYIFDSIYNNGLRFETIVFSQCLINYYSNCQIFRLKWQFI